MDTRTGALSSALAKAAQAAAEKYRAAVRHPRRIQVRYRGGERAEWRLGFTTNVSSSGLFVATGKPAALGDELEVEVLAGAEDDPVRLRAVVVRSVVREGRAKVGQIDGMGLAYLEPQTRLLKLLQIDPNEEHRRLEQWSRAALAARKGTATNESSGPRRQVVGEARRPAFHETESADETPQELVAELEAARSEARRLRRQFDDLAARCREIEFLLDRNRQPVRIVPQEEARRRC